MPLNKSYRILNKVWNKLLKFMPKELQSLKLFITTQNEKDYETVKGAYTVQEYVVIGCELLEKFKNDERFIASILAHELGHQVLGHLCDDLKITKYNEQDCDVFAMYLLKRANYIIDYKYIEDMIKYENWRKRKIGRQHKKEHGSAKERINKIRDQFYFYNSQDFN